VKYRKLYNKKWEKEFSWLVKGGQLMADDPRHPGKLYCRAVCDFCGFIFGVKADRDSLRKHERSSKHIQAAKHCHVRTQFPRIDKFARTTAAATDKKLNKGAANAEALLGGYAAAHNLYFNQFDHLVELGPKMYPDSKIAKQMHMKRTKATYMTVHGLGHEGQTFVVSMLKSSFFSLIVDEETDVSTKKVFAILVRFRNPNTKEKKPLPPTGLPSSSGVFLLTSGRSF
jgi:hypothetical protein